MGKQGISAAALYPGFFGSARFPTLMKIRTLYLDHHSGLEVPRFPPILIVFSK